MRCRTCAACAGWAEWRGCATALRSTRRGGEPMHSPRASPPTTRRQRRGGRGVRGGPRAAGALGARGGALLCSPAPPAAPPCCRAGAGGPGGGRLRAALVSIEVGLATVLVVGAALLVTSFSRLMNVDPGFRPEGALLVRLTLPARGDSLDFIDLYQRLLDAAAAVPGVSAVGAVQSAPLRGDGGERWSFAIAGARAPRPAQRQPPRHFPSAPASSQPCAPRSSPA